MASSQVLSLLSASLRGEAADFPAFQTLSLRLGRALKQANSATLEAVAKSLTSPDFDPGHVEQVRQFLARPCEAPLRLTPPAGLLPPPWLQDSEFTPLRIRTPSLFDQVDEDYLDKVIAGTRGFQRLANPLEAAARRHMRHVFEGAVKDEVAKAAAVLSPSVEKASLTTTLLRLGLNATAPRPDLQTMLLRWKQLTEKQDRYKPLKLTTALLNAAKRPLKSALAVTTTDSHRPAEALDLALLRLGRKPLHTGLRAVVSTARQTQFRRISQRLDQLEQLAANPLSPATAFYLWAHRSQLFQRSKEHNLLTLIAALRLLLVKRLSPCFHPANTSSLVKKKAISLIFAGKTEAMRQGLERLRMQTRSQRKDKVKDQLQRMLEQGNKRLRWSLRAWLLRVRADKPKARLFFALKWAGAKQLRFTLDRLKEEGRGRKAVARRILDMAKAKETKFLAFWRALKNQKSTIERATSFQQAADKLKSLGARRTSEALHLTTQLYPKVRRVVAGLVSGSRLRLQDGWTHWRLFLRLRKTRGVKAQSLLLQAIQPSLRLSFTTLNASDNPVKSAIRAFALGLQGRQRAAFERWRMGLARQALQTTEQQVKGQQLVRALERAGRKPLRSGLPRKTVVTEREKGLQLQQALRPAPLRALRPPYLQLVSKEDRARKTVKWLGLLFAQGLKGTLQRWREGTQRRGTEAAQQSALALRFQALLTKTPTRRRKAVLDLLMNDQTRLKTAIRAIISLGEKKPLLSLQRWKAFCLAQIKQVSSNTLKGQKLQSSLRPVPLRTLHGAYARVVNRASRLAVLFAGLMKTMGKPAREGLKQWRQALEDRHKRTLTLRVRAGQLTAKLLKAIKQPQAQILNILNETGVSTGRKLKGQDLRAVLEQVPRRQLAATWLRLTNRGEMLHCRLLDLVAILKGRPRAALRDWQREAEARTLQALEAQRKGLTLQSALLHTTLRPKRAAHISLFSDNFKLKNACRALLLAFSVRPKAWLGSWAATTKARTVLQQTLTANNFQSLLKSPFRKPLASSFSRITDTGKSTRARLLSLALWMKERPKAALKDWKENGDRRKLRAVQQGTKGLVLQEALTHAVKQQKRKTARFLLGDRFRRKTALRAFLLGFAVTPRLCLQRWTRYAAQTQTSMLEAAVYEAQQECRAQQFHRLLLAAGRRPTAAVLTQVTVQRRGLQRVLLGLAQVMKDSPRAVLREWKQRTETWKRTLLERVRKGTALQHSLLQAALSQKLRSAKFILGDKFKRKNALRAFFLGFVLRPRGYLKAWVQFAAQVKAAESAEQLQWAQMEAVARKFQTLLLRLPKLPLATAYKQVVRTNRGPQKLLLGLLKYMKDKPRYALIDWKVNGENRVIEYLERMATGQKLQQLLMPTVLARKRAVTRALFPDNSKLINAVRALILGFGTRPRLSLKRWSDSAAEASREQLRNGIKTVTLSTQGQKLQSCLLKVPVRTLKDSYDRVVAKDTRLKSAIRALLLGLTVGERRLFDRWKAALVKQEAEIQEGKVKAQKLQQVLGKTMRKPLRSGLPGRASQTADPRGRQLQTALLQGVRPLLRGGFDKLTDQKRLLAARLSGLLLVLKRAPRLAWGAWKSGLSASAQEALETQIKAQKLSTGLGLVARKSLAAAFHRMVSSNDVLQKTLMGLVFILKGKPRAVLRNWKDNGEAKVLGKAAAREKAAKLQTLLLRASKRTQRSTHSALLSTNFKLKSAMRAIILGLSTKPKYCLACWLKNSIPQPESSLEFPKAYKFSKLLFNIARKPLSHSLRSTVEKKSIGKSILQGLVHFLKSQPKSALQTWHQRVKLRHSQELQGTTKALQLQTLLLRSVHKKQRQTMKRVVEKEARLKGTLRAIGLVFGHRLQRYFDCWRSAKQTWKEYEEGISTALTTASEKQHSRFTLIPAKTIHIRLLSLIKYMKERPKYALREWKHRGDQELTSKISYASKGLALRSNLEKVTGGLQRKAWNRLASKGHWTKAAMRTIVAGFANRVKEYLRRWGKAVVYIPVQVPALLPTAVGPSSPPSTEVVCVPTLPAQSLPRLHHFLSALLVPVSRQQAAVLQAISEHCRTQQALDKLRSAVHILRLAANHENKAAVLWFQAWKGKLETRYQKMNRWVVINFIYNTSVSYQSGFWRWKLVKSHGELIFPHQFSFLRSVARVLNRVQDAALQRSFTLLDMLRHKERAEPQFTLHFNSSRSQSFQPTESDEEPTPRSISVILRNKFTPGEMEMVKKVGAMETFGLLMRVVTGRNLASAFVSLKDETALRELKEYNEMLMGDLGKLQEGNERLMETFKESTENLEVLSKKLDVMRTDRLVRVLDKIRVELPTFEALLMLKINANISII